MVKKPQLITLLLLSFLTTLLLRECYGILMFIVFVSFASFRVRRWLYIRWYNPLNLPIKKSGGKNKDKAHFG